jgi:ankyrin repeat protein
MHTADTPLLLAISSHQHAVVKALIAAGMDVNEANTKGETPLVRCFSSVTRQTAALDAAILG